MRMASNRLTGMPTRLAVVTPWPRRPSIRRNWKTISDAGTSFQGWSTCSTESPRSADKRRMLSWVKNHRCCGGVMSRHLAPAVVGSLRGELDPRHVEVPRRLHEEKAVGASQLKELAALAIAANEIDAAGKLAAQHRLGAEIIGVAVRTAAGKIIISVVGGGIERGRFRAAEAALAALQDIAVIDPEAKRVAARAAAGRARARAIALCRRDL